MADDDRALPPRPTPDRLPPGRLVRSRVVADLGAMLSDALDLRLDGYAVVEPQDALLLDAAGTAVVGFRGGVPVGAAHAGTGRGGPAALADLAGGGPARVELRAVARDDTLVGFDRENVRVGAATPAERLAGDQALAARTRRVVDERRRVGGANAADHAPRSVGRGDTDAAGDDRTPSADGPTGGESDPVVAFLDDEAKVEAIREQARTEARERAAEWGLTDQLADDDGTRERD